MFKGFMVLFIIMYNLLEPDNRETTMLYCNTIMGFIQFIILFVIAMEIIPLVNDANVLINDASDSLHDFSVIMPKINVILPEAQNTTRILGHMIPEITQGMRILRQLCFQDPECHL